MSDINALQLFHTVCLSSFVSKFSSCFYSPVLTVCLCALVKKSRFMRGPTTAAPPDGSKQTSEEAKQTITALLLKSQTEEQQGHTIRPFITDESLHLIGENICDESNTGV